MAESLRSMYHPAFFDRLCPVLKECIPGFVEREFIFFVFDNEWPDLDLKGRIRKISTALHRLMPGDFSNAAALLTTISSRLMALNEENTFLFAFLPDYVQRYGVNHPVESFNCLQHLTKLVSVDWSLDPDEQARSLANKQFQTRFSQPVVIP